MEGRGVVLPMKVVFATPTVVRPHAPMLNALEAAVPLLDASGLEHGAAFEVGNAYISAARATMLRKALDAKADVIVFIDHDVSFGPHDLLGLIETPGDVVAGLYRFKNDGEEYMGGLEADANAIPICRPDGCIRAVRVPAGFLKITKECVDRFMGAYPHLVYGPRYNPSVDLFNHGAIDGVWYGEDYAFCKRWKEMGEDIWIVPDLNLDHHSAPSKEYPEGRVWRGNFHEFMQRRPGGSSDPARLAVAA